MDTGSSARRYSGSRIIARAMLTRWRCPPESVWGYLEAYSSAGASRTCSSAPRTRSQRSAGEDGPWMTSGSSTRSRTRM
jgi:hypothetical protein